MATHINLDYCIGVPSIPASASRITGPQKAKAVGAAAAEGRRSVEDTIKFTKVINLLSVSHHELLLGSGALESWREITGGSKYMKVAYCNPP